jgi:hypothetical protein
MPPVLGRSRTRPGRLDVSRNPISEQHFRFVSILLETFYGISPLSLFVIAFNTPGSCRGTAPHCPDQSSSVAELIDAATYLLRDGGLDMILEQLYE